MALNVASGTYTGNGSDPQTITGVGFTPKVVFINAVDTGGGVSDNKAAQVKFTGMTTGASGVTGSVGENGQLTAGLIDSFNSDGFLVRGLKNTSTVVYNYLALGGSDVVVGTYTGNSSGATTQAITGVGFQPAAVFIQGGTSFTTFKFSSHSGATCSVSSTLADRSNCIDSLDADGFTVGTNITGAQTANNNATTYYYAAIKTGLSNVKIGNYSGNATDNRDITGVGFTPIAVIIKNTSTNQTATRYAEVGDLSSLVRNNVTPAANRIQSFSSDTFQIGTANEVNASGSSNYNYIAFGATPSAVTFIPQIMMN